MDHSSSPEHPLTPPPALEQVLVSMGCPPEKTPILASQIWKRSIQLAQQTGRSQEDALAHLLQLMKNGLSSSSPVTS